MAGAKVLILVALLKYASCQELSNAQNSFNVTGSMFPLGDVRNCPFASPLMQNSQEPVHTLEALPGIGFDNLRNIDRGQVHAYNFSSCKLSNSGNFLLPDSIFLIPVQESKIETTAEYFSHWDNYTSKTARSINLEAKVFSAISGKYSDDYSETKLQMYSNRAQSTRVQIRHGLYNVMLHPDAQLHPTFINRMYDIASNIQHNNTEYAKYLAEITVRDYGTHYTTSIIVGGVLSQSDFIQMTGMTDTATQRRNIQAEASANFFGKISLDSSFHYNMSEARSREFFQRRTHASLSTIGGLPYTRNLTLEEWTRGVVENPVTIDRLGAPLHRAITPTTLPNIQGSTRNILARYLQDASENYYRRNTRYGCTDPAASNFNLHANLNDGTCRQTPSNYSFGGTYQTCVPFRTPNTEDLCLTGDQPGQQPNPLTGGFSCPTGYTAINLQNGTVTRTTQAQVCNERCESCGFLWLDDCCECRYTTGNFRSMAYYQTYWCTILNNSSIQSDGYLFGGYYATEDTNPVTNSMSCPRFYHPVYIGADIKLCVSNDRELGYAYSVDFGGFYSCMTGNPLAHATPNEQNRDEWPHLCPSGYAQHLVTVQDDCELTVCIRSGAFRPEALIEPLLPPFMQNPIKNNNVTGLLPMFGTYGQVWVKNTEGLWMIIDPQSPEGIELLLRYNLTQPISASSSSSSSSGISSSSSSSGISRGGVAAISIVVTIVLGLAIICAVFIGHRIFKRRRKGTNPPSNSSVYTNRTGASEDTKTA